MSKHTTTAPTISKALRLYTSKSGGIGKTTDTYVARFAALHGHRTIESIQPIDILSAASANAPATVRREINAFQGFVNFARSLISLPPLACAKPDDSEPQTTRFTPKERDALLSLCAREMPWFVPHLTFLFFTGARRSELCALHWRDVQLLPDGTAAFLTLRSRKGRNGRVITRRIPVHPALATAMKAIPFHPEKRVFLKDGQPISSPATINKTLAKLTAKLKIGHLSPHDARRTFASELLAHDVPDLVITDMLGHVDKRMLPVYALADDAVRKNAIGKISNPELDAR